MTVIQSAVRAFVIVAGFLAAAGPLATAAMAQGQSASIVGVISDAAAP